MLWILYWNIGLKTNPRTIGSQGAKSVVPKDGLKPLQSSTRKDDLKTKAYMEIDISSSLEGGYGNDGHWVGGQDQES